MAYFPSMAAVSTWLGYEYFGSRCLSFDRLSSWTRFTARNRSGAVSATLSPNDVTNEVCTTAPLWYSMSQSANTWFVRMHVFAPLSAVKAGANRKKPIPRSR